MIILLTPQRRDDTLMVVKAADVLILNYEAFDFSFVGEGDTLPSAAIGSPWFAGSVDRLSGELILTMLLPNPWNYSPEQAFPVPLLDVLEGQVVFPLPLPDHNGEFPAVPPFDPTETVVVGVIDTAQLVTKAMKDAAIAKAILAAATALLNSKVQQANTQVSALAGRITTLTWLIEEQDPEDEDYTEPTAEDVAELALLKPLLTKWKSCSVKLGKVKTQPTWPTDPVWPATPALYVEEVAATTTETV